jgi:carboxypeptidase PM20D1
MRIILTAGVAIAAILIGAVFLNEDTSQKQVENYARHIETVSSPEGAVDRLSACLRVPTVGDQSASNHVSDPAPFQRLHETLEDSFPAVYKALSIEKINEFSLLMTWKGSDSALRPIILMSHMDVVPALLGANWTHPPFSGTVADGYIWGRGALDTKVTLTAILEAVQELLISGFHPQRTIILAFGHDEEVGGEYGARQIVKELEKRGIEAELVLDEGGMILADGLRVGNTPLISGPLALIGTAEKGIQDWIIELKGIGGHSSVPPTGDGTSTAARMARILSRLESQQMSTRLAPPATDFLKALAPSVSLTPIRTVLNLADNGIVNPVLGQLVGQLGGREVGAMVRSTCAVVGISAGGIAHNVLPSSGQIRLNLRILPGDNENTVREYLKTIIQKESEHAIVKLADAPTYPASPVSPASGATWDLITRAVHESLGEVKGRQQRLTVVPYLVTGMTDSRWYGNSLVAAGRVYRFSPIRINREAGDASLFHGVNERVPVSDYVDAIRFYMRLIKLAAGSEEGTASS